MELTKKINKFIFRGYDIRGKVEEDINVNVAYTIGKSYGTYIQENGFNECVVGHDNRISSDFISEALIKGILETGCDVINLGLVTTPMFYYSRILKKIPTGVMVTASHNPKDENGFKFSIDESGNAFGEEIIKFYEFTMTQKFLFGNGNYSEYNIEKDYVELIKESIDLGDRKIKVVFDCANAATTVIIKQILKEFNIESLLLFEESDGNFPNHHPDPSVEKNLDALKKKVIETKANLGLSFDGDGDRVGIIDENGNMIKIDYYMIIIWRDLINKVTDKRALFDVKCSMALEEELIKIGAKPICNRTGNSYIAHEMVKNNYTFGGEFSGHIYFNDKFPCFDCGIYAGLRLIEILSKTTKEVSSLLEGTSKYFLSPELTISSSDDKKNIVVEKIKKYAEEKLYKIILIDGVKVIFEDGWVLVRVSNTGPNLTARIEATSEARLNELMGEFVSLINEFNE